jgi:pSer/pThr/pTyr-binding forkhead associated (FHA) protein
LKAKRNGQAVAYRLDKAAVIVGSGENCNIRVPDAGLVTRHCQILKMENGYVLRDMSGDAGTFVNGKKVKEHLLADRDLIQVGKERFTFSESAGENTSRVAVSVAPPPAAKPPTARASSGNTARVAAPPPAAVAPARSGNTGRIAAPPPAAVEAPGRGTQRVNKGTQKVQKTTGRVEQAGGTKKITARTAAGMGYQTSRSTFAMPSTKKGKLIAIGGVLFILVLGGVMYAIKAGQVDPEHVKRTMHDEMQAINKKYKPDQIIEIDEAIHAVLGEHESVKKYVAQMYANIEKEHVKVHQSAIDLKKAMKDVNPFLTKYEGIKAKPEEYKKQAGSLYDECKSLSDSYGGTTLGPKLTEIQTALKKFMEENVGPSWEQNIVALQGEVRSLANKGEFAQAAAKINEFGEKFNEKEKLELFNKLKEQREFLDRQSPAFVKKEVDKGHKEITEGTLKKEEFKKKLEGFRPGLEGYKKAQEALEAAIVAIK